MDTKQAIDALGALAQETRLQVFRLLVTAGPRGMPAGEIAETLGAPASTLSFHLAYLHRAGLVLSRRESRSIIYSADFAGMNGLVDFLTQDCCKGQPELCARDRAPRNCSPRSGTPQSAKPKSSRAARPERRSMMRSS